MSKLEDELSKFVETSSTGLAPGESETRFCRRLNRFLQLLFS